MKNTAKGKPKKSAAASHKAKRPAAVSKLAGMKKVSLFLRAATIPKAHARAKKMGLPLTGYVSGLVEADLSKKKVA